MRWLRALLRRLLHGRLVELTVPADQVRLGDRIYSPVARELNPPRRPVVEITNYGNRDRGRGKTVYLAVANPYGRWVTTHYPDEPVSIERRTRP